VSGARASEKVMATRFGAPVLAERADASRERLFLATSAVLFLASAGATIGLCGSMSGDMSMPGGWTMSMAWMQMAGQSWLERPRRSWRCG